MNTRLDTDMFSIRKFDTQRWPQYPALRVKRPMAQENSCKGYDRTRQLARDCS